MPNQELYNKIKSLTNDRKQYLCCHAEMIKINSRFPIAL